MDSALVDLIKVGGLSVGAVVILIKLIDFLRWFLGTIPDALKDFGKSINDFAKSLKTIADNQTAHDAEIATLQTSTTSALTDLKTVIESHGRIVQSTIKSQDIRDEHLVSGLNDTTSAISETGTDVKKNADKNADKIILEVQKLPGQVAIALEVPFGQIREDIGKLVDPDLATKVVALIKPDVVSLIETALKRCLEDNAELAHELDHTETKLDDTKQELAKVARDALVALRNPPTEPDPPPSPDHKAAIPGDFDVVATLPRASGE